ncbi:unnamed protein product [Phytophthora fragariaefolia]|uniref:Unnamed protein product n=1 Tax=Phytophthora fragariaefolia TaxID=1490495 RepID=A0A9W6X501_9STRA|nr:unnamed protein product [Phytophthora fragariaefolia]
MKFPLARAPFAPLHLSDADKKEAVELADLFVQQTLGDYETHLDVQHGVVDEVRWKMVKRFENVVVYQDREALRPWRLARSGSGSGYEHTETPREMQKLLWFGTVQGSLDDIMYGVVNPTAEEAKVKAAYVGNNVLDFAVLETIVHPTVDDPFRGLQIKWAVNGGPTVMRSMVRCRDFVYLESTGMTTSLTGERIGYHLLHSVAVPGAPELHEHKIIRGNMTLYHLYLQKSPGVVETYVKAFIDVLGDMPSSVATLVSAKGVVSVWKLGDYAEMKKLVWLLKQHKALCSVELARGHVEPNTRRSSGTVREQSNYESSTSGTVESQHDRRDPLRVPRASAWYAWRVHSQLILAQVTVYCKVCSIKAWEHSSPSDRGGIQRSSEQQPHFSISSIIGTWFEWMLAVSSKQFPLHASPFPPLGLYQPDETAIANIANDLLVTTLVDYEMLHLREGGVMNPARWKVVKHFDNIVGYQERVHQRKLSDDDVDVDQCPRLVWHGTLDGNLSDIMYGVINQSDEEAQAKATYVRSNIVDSKVLASIATATPTDPFKGVQVKWMVSASGPKRLVRLRDFVFLEATGVTQHSSGEHMGYYLTHSISIPSLPPLHEYNLVRGNISFLHLFREKTSNSVEVYSKASLDLMGNMPSRLATYAACKTMEAMERIPVCSEMKKLAWMVRSTSERSFPMAKLSYDSSSCQLCQKDFTGSAVFAVA